MIIFWSNTFNPRELDNLGLAGVYIWSTLRAAGAAPTVGGTPLLALLGVG